MNPAKLLSLPNQPIGEGDLARIGEALTKVHALSDWDETKHPRGEHGQFGTGTGGGFEATRLRVAKMIATAVAKRWGFDPNKIDVVYNTSARGFRVGGTAFTEAGHYQPKTGRIELNAAHISENAVDEITAHEITHDAYNSTVTRPEATYDEVPLEVRDLHEFLGSNYAKLNEEDGVTPYSKAYWNAASPKGFTDVGPWAPHGDDGFVNQATGEWRKQAPDKETSTRDPYVYTNGEQTTEWENAMNETFAEISAQMLRNPVRAKAEISPTWREAHDKLLKAYKAVQNTEVLTRGGFQKI